MLPSLLLSALPLYRQSSAVSRPLQSVICQNHFRQYSLCICELEPAHRDEVSERDLRVFCSDLHFHENGFLSVDFNLLVAARPVRQLLLKIIVPVILSATGCLAVLSGGAGSVRSDAIGASERGGRAQTARTDPPVVDRRKVLYPVAESAVRFDWGCSLQVPLLSVGDGSCCWRRRVRSRSVCRRSADHVRTSASSQRCSHR